VVRIGVVQGDHVTGTLFRSDAQGIVVRQDGDTTRVAWHEVRYLQVARGRRRPIPVRNGAIAGGVLGALVGVGFVAGCSIEIFGEADPCLEAIPLGALAGAALGAGIGAIVWGGPGAGWIDVPLDRTQVAVAASPAGLGIGARIAF
jgi:hypothetical protein